MLQYHREGWQHRAVWGDYEIIPWGAAGTTERVGMGALPEAGQWVRLEFPLEQVGLKAGDALTGFALTQHGGTVYWDTIGVSGKSDPASDPRRSFVAWWKSLAGSDASSLPESLRQVAAAGPQESSDATEALRRYYIAQVCVDTATQVADAKGEVARLRGEREGVANSAPSTFIFRDLMQPRESFVMMRGAYDKPADRVEPNTPAILPPLTKLDPNRRANRLDLATWLVSDEHPLTARVAVNRHWQQFFGVGLVKTSADFGSQGEMPSHPELLDWLAIDFRENGWDVKRLVRSIVTSKAFRQSTVVDADELTRDPENRLLARGPRIRLAAEQIRDNALAVSGLLVRKFGGPGVKPYQPANIWEPVGFAGSNTRFYTADKGEALYRRSIYTFFKRTAPPPFMTNFDAPNREQSCAVRERSNTPLQALQLMNDVQHVEAARMLAQRILKEAPASDEARVDFVFREVLCRAADAEEMGIVLRQLGAHRERYAADAAGEEAARKLVSQGETPFDSELSVAELASWTLVANMVLNLDETLTRN